MQHSWLLPLVVLLPWVGALVVLATGRAVKAARRPGYRRCSGGRCRQHRSSSPWPPASPPSRSPSAECSAISASCPDGLGVFLAAVAAVIGCLAVIFSVDYMRGRGAPRPLLLPGAVLHRRDGRSGALQQPAAGVRLLGDHRALLLRPDLLPQRRSQGGGRRHQGADHHPGWAASACWPGALLLYAYPGSYDIPTFLAQARTLPAGAPGVDGASGSWSRPRPSRPSSRSRPGCRTPWKRRRRSAR